MKMQEQTKPEVPTSLRLSSDEHAYIKALAESQHRSISGQIRFLIAEHKAQREAA